MATHRARSGRTAGASERASAGALAGRRKRRLRPDDRDARNEVIANVAAGRRLTLEKDEPRSPSGLGRALASIPEAGAPRLDAAGVSHGTGANRTMRDRSRGGWGRDRRAASARRPRRAAQPRGTPRS